MEGDPWSLRQTGVYQKLNTTKTASRWILIQASDRVIERIEEGLQYQESHAKPPIIHSTQIHAAIVGTLARDTSDYIDYLRSRLRQYVSGSYR